MPEDKNNVVSFPIERRRRLQACPQCGAHTDIWRIGRLLWAYCDIHQLRWVAADYRESNAGHWDRTRLRKRLEYLASLTEVQA